MIFSDISFDEYITGAPLERSTLFLFSSRISSIIFSSVTPFTVTFANSPSASE